MITRKDERYLKSLIDKFSDNKKEIVNHFPLLEKGFTNADIMRGIEVLLSRKLTMSEITKKFENSFANYIGSKYALMVNSGSSANLLAAFALVNPQKKRRLKRGDSFIIPAICWSTSLWPMVQCGLRPKFVDVNINNFCLDETLLKKDKTLKAIMNIHILGNSTNMDILKDYAKNNKMFMIEDTCEALGSKYKSKYLGTFGDFGTYSFYYSHQITSGEGGMIICKTKEDHDILYAMRSHGWDRGLYNSQKVKNFNFINSGFNVRGMDLTAAIGLSQLKRLNNMIKSRSRNRNLIINKLRNHISWDDQFTFFNPNENVKPSWFGLPLLINKKLISKKTNFLRYLNYSGVETRPILSGNFLNQKACKLYKFNYKKKDVKVSQEIEDRGFFIGLPTKDMSSGKLDFLCEKLMNIKQI